MSIFSAADDAAALDPILEKGIEALCTDFTTKMVPALEQALTNAVHGTRVTCTITIDIGKTPA